MVTVAWKALRAYEPGSEGFNGTDEALAMERFTLKDRYAIEESATAPGKELSHCCEAYLQAYCLIEETWIEIHKSLAAEGFLSWMKSAWPFLGLWRR